MTSNSIGKIFNFTTWGESHGKAIGCVVDGVPSNINLTEKDIQPYLDKRKPGQSKFTTQRKEEDKVEILSGTFEGKTTGHPISLIIYNQDQRSKDYGDIKSKFRPGHADYTYWKKYGIRDYRGGGRSSARETAMRVAAGAIARKIIKNKIKNQVVITGALIQIGNHKINYDNWNNNFISKNNFWSPDKEIIKTWEKSDGHLPEVHKAAIKVAFEYNNKYQKFQNPENWWLQTINMSGASYAYPIPEKKMDKYILGNLVSEELRQPDWRLENIGYHPYKAKQPNGYSDISTDWLSTELIIRRLMYAKEAFHQYKIKDQLDDTIHEKIIRTNFDNPDKILKIVAKAKSNEEKHMILFNLPEVLRA